MNSLDKLINATTNILEGIINAGKDGLAYAKNTELFEEYVKYEITKYFADMVFQIYLVFFLFTLLIIIFVVLVFLLKQYKSLKEKELDTWEHRSKIEDVLLGVWGLLAGLFVVFLFLTLFASSLTEKYILYKNKVDNPRGFVIERALESIKKIK